MEARVLIVCHTNPAVPFGVTGELWRLAPSTRERVARVEFVTLLNPTHPLKCLLEQGSYLLEFGVTTYDEQTDMELVAVDCTQAIERVLRRKPYSIDEAYERSPGRIFAFEVP